MNPLLREFLSSILRKLLTALGAWFIARGYFSADQSHRFIDGAIDYLIGAIPLAVSTAWSAWATYRKRQKLATALASSVPQTENQLETQISAGVSAPASTPKTEVPEVQIPN